MADASLAPAMDIFSVGCVIAEMFLEGQALFDLATLLAFRNGKHDPQPMLDKVPDAGIRDMIGHMIQRDPAARLNAQGYLHQWASDVFPPYFSPFLHHFFSRLDPLDTDMRVAFALEFFPEIQERMLGGGLGRQPADQSGDTSVSAATSEGGANDGMPTVITDPLGVGSVGRRVARDSTDVRQDKEGDSKTQSGAANQNVPGGSKPSSGKVEGKASSSLVADLSKLLSDVDGLKQGIVNVGNPFLTGGSRLRGQIGWPGSKKGSTSIQTERGGPTNKVNEEQGSPTGPSVTSFSEVRAGDKFGSFVDASEMPAGAPRLVEIGRAFGTAARPKAVQGWLLEEATSGDEVADEEVYEYQVRESRGNTTAAPLRSGDLGEVWTDAGLSLRKEDIGLPAAGGWLWDGKWELDSSAGGSDGWQYCKAIPGEAGRDANATSAVSDGSESEGSSSPILGRAERQFSKRFHSADGKVTPGSDCLWRRRRWVRRRRRRPSYPPVSHEPGDLLFSSAVPRGSRPWRPLKTRAAQKDYGEDTVEQTVKCEGMVLMASLLCACLRNITLPQSRRACVELLRDVAAHCDDDTRLQRIIPFIVSLLPDERDASNHDNPAVVRCAALYALTDVLAMVETFPATDSQIFPEYIFPFLSLLPRHTEESVRSAYAENISKLAQTAQRFLALAYKMAEKDKIPKETSDSSTSDQDRDLQSSFSGGGGTREGAPSSPATKERQLAHDRELNKLREIVKQALEELVTGPQSSPAVRCTILRHMAALCRFFGRKYSNDFLLPLLITFLNDRAGQVRTAFFQHIAPLCVYVGRTSLEAFLLPCIEQALNDDNESVIANALGCLTSLTLQDQLRKRVLLGACERSAPLLCHPGPWVRKAAASFIASAGISLSPADSHSFLLPILAPLLDREPTSLSSERALIACLKPPLAKDLFDFDPRSRSQVGLADIGGANKLTPGRYAAKRGVSEKRLQGKPGSGADLLGSVAGLSGSAQARNRSGKRASGVSQDMLANPGGASSVADDGKDEDRSRAAQSYVRNSSAMMQSRFRTWDEEASEKVQSMGPGSGGGRAASSFSQGGFPGPDLPVSGLPVYSIMLPDKNPENGFATLSEFLGGNQKTTNPQLLSNDWTRSSPLGGAHKAKASGTLTGGGFGPMSTLSFVATGQSMLQASQNVQQIAAITGTVPPNTRVTVYGRIQGAKEGPGPDSEPDQGSVVPGSAVGIGSFGLGNGMSSRLRSLGSAQAAAGGTSSSAASSSGGAAIQDAGTGLVGLNAELASSADASWRPKGVLVAHFQEHQKAVNQIAVSPANAYFLSASDDGTVRIWDLRKVEKDVSFRSRLTYKGLSGRALCVTTLEANLAAVSSSSGEVHTLDVNHVPKSEKGGERYSGVSTVKKIEEDEGPVLTLDSLGGDQPNILLYGTLRGGLHLSDIRAKRGAAVLRQNPNEGYVTGTAFHPGGEWVVTATSRGVLSLWDLRFRVRVNTWQHPGAGIVDSVVALLPGVGGVVSSASAPPLVYVAAGRDELALWNAETATCHQVLRVAPTSPDGSRTTPSELPAALASPRSTLPQLAPKRAQPGTQRAHGAVPGGSLGVEELNSPQARVPGVRAILPLLGGAAVMTAGTDCRIRVWDRYRPDKSLWVCGPTVVGPPAGEALRPRFDERVIAGVRVLQELPPVPLAGSVGGPPGGQAGPTTSSLKSALAAAATDGAGCHRDAILALASASLSQRLVISSSRDGAIKVWR